MAGEYLTEGVRGVVLHAGQDVLVGHHRERRIGVTEPFGHDLDRHSVPQQQGGVGVSEVVEPDRGHRQAPLGAFERLRRGVGVERLPAWSGEHKGMAVVDASFSECSGLTGTPVGEQRHGVGVDGDVAATRLGLQPRELEAVPDGGERLGDFDPAGVEVDVIPSEPEQLATAHPRRCSEPEQHRMAARSGFGEELSELYRGPRRSSSPGR